MTFQHLSSNCSYVVYSASWWDGLVGQHIQRDLMLARVSTRNRYNILSFILCCRLLDKNIPNSRFQTCPSWSGGKFSGFFFVLFSKPRNSYQPFRLFRRMVTTNDGQKQLPEKNPLEEILPTTGLAYQMRKIIYLVEYCIFPTIIMNR